MRHQYLGKKITACILAAGMLLQGAAYTYAQENRSPAAEAEEALTTTETESVKAQDDADLQREQTGQEGVNDSQQEQQTDQEEVSAEESQGDEGAKAETSEENAAAEAECGQSAQELGYVPGEILIVYGGESEEAAADAAESLDGTLIETVAETEEGSIGVVEISDDMTVEEAVSTYEADEHILYAEPNYVLVSMEDGGEESRSGSYDYLAAIGQTGESGAAQLLQNWKDSGNQGTPVSVGVIDHSFNLSSSLLSAYVSTDSVSMAMSDSEITRSALSQEDYDASNPHGTKVASILANAAGDALKELVLVDAAVGEENTYTVKSVAAALQYLTDETSVQIINMSFGTQSGTTSEILTSAVNAAYNKGIILVSAAGNNTGTDAVYPSDYEQVISVMAADQDGNLWSGSGYGEKKDLAAPGTGIQVEGITDTEETTSGTSLSAPMVSAAAAQLLYVDPSLTIYQILNLLKETAAPVNGASDGMAIIQIGAALEKLLGSSADTGSTLADAVIDCSKLEGSVYYPGCGRNIWVVYQGKTLECNTDYVITDSAYTETAEEGDTVVISVTIEGRNSFTGSKTASFTVQKRNLQDCESELYGSRILTDGAQVTPAVEVTYKTEEGTKVTLTRDVDFSLTYGANNTIGENAGSVHITGTGFYCGEADLIFSISSEEELIASGSCGEGLTYRFYGNGSLLIEGSGEMQDAAGSTGFHALENKYGVEITYAELSEGITSVGSYAFADCASLEQVVLPDTVTKLGEKAFADCEKLPEIELKENLQSIGALAFDGCYALTEIYIPSTVTSVGKRAFRNTYIKYVDISDLSAWFSVSFESTGGTSNPLHSGGAFRLNGTEITSITVPGEVKEISACALTGSMVTEVILESGITKIGDFAFAYCTSLQSVSLPDTLTEIGAHAFVLCNNLSEISIPASLKRVGTDAFEHCTRMSSVQITDLDAWMDIEFENAWANPAGEAKNARLYLNGTEVTSVTVSGDTKELKSYVFFGYTGITEIILEYGPQSIGAWALGKTGITEIEIPDSVTEIGRDAFHRCEQLKKVTLSKKLTKLETCLFFQCTSLTQITIPDSVTEIGLSAFYFTGLTEITLPEGLQKIGNYAFEYTKLTEITIPNTVTEIGNGAFAATNLTTAVIEEGTEKLADYAFLDCDRLTSVTLPGTLREIGKSAFHSCSSLKNIYIPDSVVTIGANAFQLSGLEEAEFPEGLQSIGGGAFLSCNLTSATLPENCNVTEENYRRYFNEEVAVTFSRFKETAASGTCGETVQWEMDSKGNLAIYGTGEVNPFTDGTSVWSSIASSVSAVSIGEGITGITADAFSGFENLGYLKLPETLTEIGDYAFAYDTSLKKLSIPESLQTIGAGAFYGCTGLSELALSEVITKLVGDYQLSEIRAKAFAYCTNLKKLDLYRAEKLTEIGEDAFGSCMSLESCELPGSLENIGKRAFFNCTKLSKVWFAYLDDLNRIPSQLKKIGDSAFAYCSSLEDFYSAWEGPFSSLATIGDRAFLECRSLTEIDLYNSQITKLGDYTFYGCESLSSFAIPVGVTTVGDYAFYGSGLTEINIPNQTAKIGDFSFAYSKALTSAVFKNETTQIGAYAFLGCSLLEHAALPSLLTKLQEGTFAECPALKDLVLPESLQNVGDYAFYERENVPNGALSTVRVSGQVGKENVLLAVTDKDGYTVSADAADLVDVSLIDNADGTQQLVYTAKAPGTATVVLSDSNGALNKYIITIKTPIEADSEDYYKQTAYVVRGDTSGTSCSHSVTKVTEQAATCKEEGVRAVVCSICNAVLSSETIPVNAGNHTGGAHTSVQYGWKLTLCDDCGAVLSRSASGSSGVTPIPADKKTEENAGNSMNGNSTNGNSTGGSSTNGSDTSGNIPSRSSASGSANSSTAENAVSEPAVNTPSEEKNSAVSKAADTKTGDDTQLASTAAVGIFAAAAGLLMLWMRKKQRNGKQS